MIEMKNSAVIGLFIVACSGESFDDPLFTGAGTGGAAGETGVDAGAGTGGAAGEAGAGPCGPLMLQSGSVCVDARPALRADGSQGPAVSWGEAASICEGRGARLCTESERETACPGGQWPEDVGGENQAFCAGPGNTWEWSASAACPEGRCMSPCCNSVTNPCQCTTPIAQLQGYRCCKDV